MLVKNYFEKNNLSDDPNIHFRRCLRNNVHTLEFAALWQHWNISACVCVCWLVSPMCLSLSVCLIILTASFNPESSSVYCKLNTPARLSQNSVLLSRWKAFMYNCYTSLFLFESLLQGGCLLSWQRLMKVFLWLSCDGWKDTVPPSIGDNTDAGVYSPESYDCGSRCLSMWYRDCVQGVRDHLVLINMTMNLISVSTLAEAGRVRVRPFC